MAVPNPVNNLMPEAKQPEVHRAIGDLEHTVSVLYDLIKTLSSRLKPVLSPACDRVEREKCLVTGIVVVDAIDAQKLIVSGLLDDLEDLISHLEV